MDPTPGRNQALAVATDHGNNIIVTGTTEGNLAGPNAGGADVFVRQYTPDGEVVWTEQFGTARRDGGIAVAVDARGNIIVAGDSAVALTGRNITGAEGFVRRYKPNPSTESVTEDWTHYTDIFVDGLAVDADGNVFVVGSQRVAGLGSEVYILKLSPAGAVQWSTLFGTGKESQEQGGERDAVPETRRLGERWENLRGLDMIRGVATGAYGSIFIVGYTLGDLDGTNLGRQDAYLRRFGD